MPTDTRGNAALLDALEKLRSTLLDLTGRNRLLNFKHTAAKSIQFIDSDIDATFHALVANGNRVQLLSLPEPDESELLEVNGRIKWPDNRQYAASRGINCSYDLNIRTPADADTPAHRARLQTLFYPDQLGAHGRKIDREARLAIEETGTNMLHLVVGFLEYPDRPGGDGLWLAPLLCIPVAIERSEGMPFPRFHITATGEELAANLSLREKLLRDYDKFRISEYDIESSETASAYLSRVADDVKDIPRWRVRPMMTLTLLSFSNMLLLRELEPANWPDGSLENHPLVQRLLSGQGGNEVNDYAAEYAIDDHPRRNLPLVYDADSSQHSALIDVLDGQSRVIEGPPGTGKSQTITNLIAGAISEGKKVLFVAEKLAALEVVKSRLTRAGLGGFVLELHGTKSSRKELLKHISSRNDMRASQVDELDDALQQAESRHRLLRAYADAMNSVLRNSMSLTAHQVLWRAERHRLKLEEHAVLVQDLDFIAAHRLDATGFEDAISQLDHLGQQFTRIKAYGPSHPLWGFFPATLNPEDDVKIHKLLTDHVVQCEAFDAALLELKTLMNSSAPGVTISEESADTLLAALYTLTPPAGVSSAARLLPELFSAEDPLGAASERVLTALQDGIAELRAAESKCAAHLLPSQFPTAEVVAQADAMRTRVDPTGIGQLTASALDQLTATLKAEAERLQQALRLFAKTADLVGMEFSPDAETGRRISRLVSLADQASAELLAFRHDGLERPNASRLLKALIVERDRLATERERLGQTFYLDEAWSEAEVTAAVRTFREGDAWYRILQPRWRSAIRLHRRLARDKSRVRAHQRKSQLEALAQFTRDRTAWMNDPVLRELTGPHCAGDKSPLEQLLATARWMEAVHEVSEETGVPAARLTDRRTLHSLAQEKTPLQRAAADIRAASQVLQATLTQAKAKRANQQQTTALEGLQHLAAQTASESQMVADLLKRCCRDQVPAQTGLEAILASATVRRQREALASQADASTLLGDAFQGPETQLAPLLAAHSFGRSIKAAGVLPAIERLLLSADSVRNHAALTRHTKAVRDGWQAWRTFCHDMSQLGTFSPEQWTPTADMTTSEFAAALHVKATRAASGVFDLLPWTQYVVARARALELGLAGFIEALEQRGLPPEKIRSAFAHRFYASIAKLIFQTSATFAQFSADRHSAVRREYAALDKKIVALRGQHIANACIRRAAPPLGQNGTRVNDKTEMRLLQHLFPQQQPRVPVRQILQRSGRAIQELMPCFMMGPQAVARFLEPGSLSFDIVVMDEASQLPPAQAIGAIARGTQLVVVGDPKQLPPTSFFTGGATPADDLAVTDAESILDICISQFRPTRQLRWHYRSQHQSLIAFSNQRFYDGKLIVFPSPHEKSPSLGVSYQYVEDGLYQDQMNEVEASRVVDAAVEHILTRPDDSLGLVTLNIKQRDLLAEMLDERLKSLPESHAFREHWGREGMGLFVKNLETVQGDERDCILISTTFGRAPGTTVVRQHFGPISRDGGWRRLNVLFTRARKAIRVYSSMQPEDIVADASTPEGTRCLRSYLEFARDGIIQQTVHTDRPPESDFEVAVIDTLLRKGYEVTPQLGVAGFRIDIAVKHPHFRSSYLAAIECDGATYHSGVSVRDRDRIRQEILESLGWRDRIWRIWSTDWFRNPRGESERMFAFLETLASQPLPGHEDAVSIVPYEPNRESAKAMAASVRRVDNYSRKEGLLFDLDDEDLSIEAGDAVTIYRLGNPENRKRIKVTDGISDLEHGLVGPGDEFGSALLGATVGEHVVVRPPGKPPRTYVVKEIQRDNP